MVVVNQLTRCALDGLTSFARVTWFDRRGIGLSDRCTADHLPTVSDWVRDLEAVLGAIGASVPVVYACEDATAVALHLAVLHPERLAGIVLTNAYVRFTRGEGYPHGFDPLIAAQSASEVAAAEPTPGGVDLLTIIARRWSETWSSAPGGTTPAAGAPHPRWHTHSETATRTATSATSWLG